MIDLYRRNIWHDAKTVNVITSACFSKVTKVSIDISFFLQKIYVVSCLHWYKIQQNLVHSKPAQEFFISTYSYDYSWASQLW
jgi:hypothetical protein